MTAKNLIDESQSLGIMGGKRFSITFSRRTEDQTLLWAVAAEITKGNERNFGSLCKKALTQYLLNRGGTDHTPSAVTLFLALQQQIVDLQVKLAIIENSQNQRSDQQFSQLEAKIHQLQQQLELFSNSQPGSKPPIIPSNLPFTDENSPPPESKPPIDPLLTRLSSILENF